MAPTLISVARARALVLAHAAPLESEIVAIDDALGRTLAAPVRAAGAVPPFACSAMDGYAVLAGEAGQILAVVGESRAGTPSAVGVSSGTAVRISTGAAIPDGADAVVRQEDVGPAGDGTIALLAAVSPGRNIRGAGEDMQPGQQLLDRGDEIGIAELGVAVAAGLGELAVSRRPRVTVLCTGDELRAPGEPLEPGQIHNSNGPMLAALARRAGADAPGARRLADALEATTRALSAALAESDVVLVSGGVSVGPHDHVKPALAALGVEEVFWRVALQPGKPTWFGRAGGTLVFGLPGNPVSAVVTFVLFALPAIDARLGRRRPDAVIRGRLQTPVTRNREREQAIRVQVRHAEDGTWAAPTGAQGSHLVTSLLGADALALIPKGEGTLPAGAAVALERLPR